MPCQFAGTLKAAKSRHRLVTGTTPDAATSRMPRRVGLQLPAQQCVATVAAEWPSPRSSIPGGSVRPGAPSGVLQHALSVNGRVAGRPSAARSATSYTR